MRPDYFKRVANSLLSFKNDANASLNFILLKTYEYWIRVIRYSKHYPDADDCIRIFPKENVAKILNTLSAHFAKINEDEDAMSPQERMAFIMESNDKYIGKRIDSDDENKSIAYQRRRKAMNRFKFLVDHGCSGADVSGYVENYLNGEGIFDKSAQKVFYDCVIDELVEIMFNNPNFHDDYFRRLNIMQQSFGLNDTEMEVLMFSWIFFNKSQCECLLRTFRSDNRFSDPSPSDVFPLLFPELEFEKAISCQGPLKQMGLLDDHLDTTVRVDRFLDGQSGDDLDSLYFQVYEGDSVPYKMLCRDNPKIQIAFDMLKYAQKGQGLNLFFYGVEGTGKTELAKSIASKLHRPLVLTNISTKGIHRNNLENATLQERMGSILFAATKYKNQKAILLVDESDIILNNCEKGALNFFLEQIKVPVIWISNMVDNIENSTLRRFDYSIYFERPDAEKRLQVWESVVREQNAKSLLSQDTIRQLSAELPITAGGITLAVAGTKRLVMAGCDIDPVQSVRTIAEAQAELLKLNLEYVNRDKESRSPRYLFNALNTDADMSKVLKVMNAFDSRWKQMKKSDRPDSLNMLLYGPPGTGKTEFAKHLARTLNRKLVVKKASDLLNCYVGDTEKNIRQMFKDAEESKAILFLDEADSLIRDRSGANHSWEVSQVNEMLTQMENFKGIFIAATNFDGTLDMASRRRFALKVKFGYLKPEGIEALWRGFFPSVACPDAAKNMRMLAPGDFNAAYSTLRFYDETELTADAILSALKSEIAYKDGREGRTMGL